MRSSTSDKNTTLSTYNCGHNDVPIRSQRFWKDITALLGRARVLGKSAL